MSVVVVVGNSLAGIVAFRKFTEGYQRTIKAVVILSQLHGRTFSTRSRRAVNLLRQKSLRFLLYRSAETWGYQGVLLAHKLLHTQSYRGSQGLSIAERAARLNIPVLKASDASHPAFIRQMADLSADYMLSLFATQIFNSALLSTPKMGALNVHGSLLPGYRGSAPYFWVLVNQEPKAGITVHLMVEQLDEGAILLQKSTPIESEETVHSLHYRLAHLAGIAAAEVLNAPEQYMHSISRRAPRTEAVHSRYRLPDRSELGLLYENGFKLCRFTDFIRMV